MVRLLAPLRLLMKPLPLPLAKGLSRVGFSKYTLSGREKNNLFAVNMAAARPYLLPDKIKVPPHLMYFNK